MAINYYFALPERPDDWSFLGDDIRVKVSRSRGRVTVSFARSYLGLGRLEQWVAANPDVEVRRTGGIAGQGQALLAGHRMVALRPPFASSVARWLSNPIIRDTCPACGNDRRQDSASPAEIAFDADPPQDLVQLDEVVLANERWLSAIDRHGLAHDLRRSQAVTQGTSQRWWRITAPSLSPIHEAPFGVWWDGCEVCGAMPTYRYQSLLTLAPARAGQRWGSLPLRLAMASPLTCDGSLFGALVDHGLLADATTNGVLGWYPEDISHYYVPLTDHAQDDPTPRPDIVEHMAGGGNGLLGATLQIPKAPAPWRAEAETDGRFRQLATALDWEPTLVYELVLRDPTLSALPWARIAEFKNLQVLDLEGSNVGDLPDSLSELRLLRRVVVAGTPMAERIADLRTRFPGVQVEA